MRIDPALIRRACGDGDTESVHLLAETLLANAERRGQRHKAERSSDGDANLQLQADELPDSDLNNYLYRMLKTCLNNRSGAPDSLIALLRFQLGQDRPAPTIKGKARALLDAKYILKRNPEATNADIARNVGVNRSTVGQWRKAGKLP
jgi:hypothetical protein